ncbi:unnamed protein product [Rhizoctonia solani]|uniref:Terpene synthase n=1 Tax=Rhizoctonia solani TaxID=456999 RepID=A0A8H3HQG9_9AGAM|nr:unnamed protein product [Rhizoctonia solani]
MSISKSHPIDRSSFPRSIRIPDTAGRTRDVFTLKLNPYHEEAESGSLAWFDSFASYCYPEADLEHLRPVMDFIIWLVAFDDMVDEGEFCDSIEALKHAFDITMNVLRNPDASHPDLKYVVALKSFYNRMRANANPGALRRFVEGAEGYTKAAVQDTIDRAAGRILTIEEYIQLRAESSGVKWAYAAMEYAHGIELPDEVHNDPIIVELGLAANQILTWSNDIYSFSLEQAKGYTHNLLFVVMWNKQLDLRGAVDFVDKMIEKRIEEYLDTKKKLRSFGPDLDDQTARYIQGIEYCIQANINWSLMSPRYFGPEFEKIRETRIVELMAPITKITKEAEEVKTIMPVTPSDASTD